MSVDACPCGRRSSYDDCCGRLHRGEIQAGTAEQLMRARYSAFATQDGPYLLRSWHPSTRPRRIAFDPTQRWVSLELLATTGGDLLDADGTVEFLAHHERGTQVGVLHELSRFVRHEHRWVYLGPVDFELT